MLQLPALLAQNNNHNAPRFLGGADRRDCVIVESSCSWPLVAFAAYGKLWFQAYMSSARRQHAQPHRDGLFGK